MNCFEIGFGWEDVDYIVMYMESCMGEIYVVVGVLQVGQLLQQFVLVDVVVVVQVQDYFQVGCGIIEVVDG